MKKKWIKNWFSNMEPFDTPMEYEGMVFNTVEHFYQAMKCRHGDVDGRMKIANAPTPFMAKRYGRKVSLRHDWEGVKIGVMELALRYKFAEGTTWHGRLLLEVQNGPIVEVNNWHDNYWGDCICSTCDGRQGFNMLGRLLTKIGLE